MKPCNSRAVNLTSHVITFQWMAISVMGLIFFVTCSVPSSPSPLVYATATIEPKTSKGWQIKFTMSGGFAGLRRSIELFNSGQMIATDQKTNKQINVQVPEAEMEKISFWVIHAQPALPVPRRSNCKDCFEYEMTIYREGGEILSFWFNDITLEKNELAPLINTLAHLQEKALSGQLTPQSPSR